MKRRHLLTAGGLIAAAGCYGVASEYREATSDSSDSGDSRQNDDVEEPNPNPDSESEGEGENSSGNNSENDSDPENNTESNSTEAEQNESDNESDEETPADANRPDDATETITITSHEINIEEYSKQDYTEVYVTGTAETGEYPLSDVQIGAAGLDQSGQPIAENSVPYATADANSEIEFEVPLNVDPDLLGSYEVAVVDASYAD